MDAQTSGDTLDTLLVPDEYATIQAAVDAATDGDTVLVAPGAYGPVTIDTKNITLASEFHTTGERSAIAATVIDGGGGIAALTVRDTDATTRIIGFTIENADDGVRTRDAHFEFLDNVVRQTRDGIDYESSSSGTTGGVVRDSVFENNSDDGIDLDDSVDIVIEDSVLRNNGNDGVEIRLHGYSGPTLNVVLRRNEIYGNTNDGIQLIGYPAPSDRSFTIEHNLIHDNGDAGVGLMDDAETREDFRGAPLPDPIHVANNTFDNNAWALTGGANLTFVNNAVINSGLGGLKNLTGASSVSYSGFWQNALDSENANLGRGLVFSDPQMTSDYRLTPGSPYVDAGDPTCIAANGTICDIGRFELESAPPPVGGPPVANDDAATTDEHTAVVVDVAANDTDPDGDNTLDLTSVTTVAPGPETGTTTDNDDGTITYTPAPDTSGEDTFGYMICDTAGLCDTATVTVTVTTAAAARIYLSLASSGGVPGIAGTVSDEDIVVYDPATGTFAMHFDASDVGIASSDLSALHVRADGSLLMSFSRPTSVPGLAGGPDGAVIDDSDIVLFSPVATGEDTRGAFTFFLDGSDVDLTRNGEDIDGLHEYADGTLAISTTGSMTAGAFTGRDEDVHIFAPSSTGAATGGTWAGVDFDGSDIGLIRSADDVDALSLEPSGDLLYSTTGTNSVPGSADEDINRFVGTLGRETHGAATVELDGSAVGIEPGNDIDAVHTGS